MFPHSIATVYECPKPPKKHTIVLILEGKEQITRDLLHILSLWVMKKVMKFHDSTDILRLNANLI